MKAVAYIRVSTEDQANKGVSLSAQEEKIRSYALVYDLEITELIKDAGFSAKNMNRPGIKNLISLMQKKTIEAVIVSKLDRLTRNIKDLSEIVELSNKKGIVLISVGEHLDSESAAGRMIVNMIGVIANWEREVIGERTATSLRFKRDSGLRYNAEPLYGFRHNGKKLEKVEDELEIIESISLLYQKGISYTRIASRLNRMRKHTRSGGKWYAQQVKRVIQKSEIRETILKKTNFDTLAA